MLCFKRDPKCFDLDFIHKIIHIYELHVYFYLYIYIMT